jgi:hypothetical protein
MPAAKATKMYQIIFDLCQKYQVEVLKPNVDYIVSQVRSPNEIYKVDSNYRQKKLKLISFRQPVTPVA